MTFERKATTTEWQLIIADVRRRRAIADSDVASYYSKVASGERAADDAHELSLLKIAHEYGVTQRILDDLFEKAFPTTNPV